VSPARWAERCAASGEGREGAKGEGILQRQVSEVNGGVETYVAFVRPYHASRDPAHDIRHIERIASRLRLLSEGMAPPPRKALLWFLAAFHGLEQRLAADETFRGRALQFLRGLGWSEEEIEEAFASLQRYIKCPKTTEERIVHDANFLELLGAFGIAKAFMMGGVRGQSYEETAEIYEQQYLDPVEFRTPVGQRLAEEGRAYAKAFLERLRREG